MNLRTTVLHASLPFFVVGLLLSFFQLRKAFARRVPPFGGFASASQAATQLLYFAGG